MLINKTIIVATLAAVTAAANAATPFERVADGHLHMAAGSATVRPDFSCRDLTAESVVWSQNFDQGAIPTGWTKDAESSYVDWTVKQIAPAGQEKSFSAIDADDAASLFVEGPYQVYRRETSYYTTEPIAVPANCTLRLWVGYSLNFDDECRLKITASTDGFASQCDTLWSSEQSTGERPWAWRPVTASLDAYAGQSVQLRLVYGPGGKDSFNTGGYSGDFAIDGMQITAVGQADQIDVTTGQRVSFVDLSEGDIASYLWTMPGATPSTSTMQNPTVFYRADGDYDVSLTVTGTDGTEATLTRPQFVHVTGIAPTAHIGLPATFRVIPSRLPFIAPLAPVTFADASEGYPTACHWTLTGVSPTANELAEFDGDTVTAGYWFRNRQAVQLDVSNMHGQSTATEEVFVDYAGNITNFRPGDMATRFSMDDSGWFPGSNKMKITAYAERFSAPSRPMRVYGVYVYFLTYKAEEVVDQIAPITVSLYTAKDGVPDRRLDSSSWSAFELDMPQGDNLTGTAFEFSSAPVVDGEFFVVIEGIPEYSETCEVTFAMAGWRGEGNTALMLKDGQWVDVSTYFPAGANHTSYCVQLDVAHSVMAPADGNYADIEVGPAAGSADYVLFSYMGWKLPTTDESTWCRITNPATNDLTVDTLHIAYDMLPLGVRERRATLHLTDGITTLPVTVHQSQADAVTEITADDADAANCCIYSLDGIRMDARRRLAPGVYVARRADGTAVKILRR